MKNITISLDKSDKNILDEILKISNQRSGNLGASASELIIDKIINHEEDETVSIMKDLLKEETTYIDEFEEIKINKSDVKNYIKGDLLEDDRGRYRVVFSVNEKDNEIKVFKFPYYMGEKFEIISMKDKEELSEIIKMWRLKDGRVGNTKSDW